MSERTPIHFSDRIISRRSILKAAGGAFLVGAGVVSCSDRNEAPGIDAVDPKSARLIADGALVGRVKDFELEQGDKRLSIEDAREYVPVLAEFFNSAAPSGLSTEELLSHTFVYSSDGSELKSNPNIAPIEELRNTNLIRELQLAYPDLTLSDDEVRRIAGQTLGSILGTPLAYVFKNKLFMNMTGIASVRGPSFDKIENELDCQISKPAEQFRSIFLHELAHLSADLTDPSTWRTPSLAFAEHYVGNQQKISDPEPSGGFGFTVMLDDKRIGVSVGGFEEITAHYIAARISEDNVLRFITNSYDPHELSNFERILGGAGIDTKELLTLHRTSDLEGIVRLFAKSAKRPKKMNGDAASFEEQVIDEVIFAIENSTPPSWYSLKDYFPKLDPNRVDYWPPSTVYQAEGCKNPSPYPQEVTK